MITTVIKVGGSQARHDALPDLCTVLGRTAGVHPLLIVPGGGGFADAVRECAERFPLSNTAAHWMAILAMDQYGLVLADLIPGSRAVRTLSEAEAAVGEGRVPVLLPHDGLRRTDPLPHSWDVTSDSIAAWVAAQASASRLVLVKDVDGLYLGNPKTQGAVLMENIDPDQLQGNNGVDRHMAAMLERAAFETWVVNGRAPERVRQLLDHGTTRGTRVARKA